MLQIKYLLCFPLLLPLIIRYFFFCKDQHAIVCSDIQEMNRRCGLKKGLFWYIVNKPPYRNLFYCRIGLRNSFTKFVFKPYPLFFINVPRGNIGKNQFVLNHPYGTYINAKKIGDNFTCCQLTTIGNKFHGRNDLIPTIGNNVSLGANVSILGNVSIGDNVIVGAGCVIVKDIPANSVVVGNPAKIIKNIE